jgi:hypothetical protein
MLTRYLFGLSEDVARSHREVAALASINMLQDAIEAFFLAAADHLSAEIGRRTEFEQYIDKINEKLPEHLPFRQRLIEMNKVRVLAKHNGVPPNTTELAGYLVEARQFFEEGCQKIFGRSFWTVSLVELLPNSEARGYVTEAEKFYHSQQYHQCLVECRKAIYVEIEDEYVIESFKSGENALWQAICKAPQYTRSKQFIEEHVKDPFDYVRLDRDRVDADLLRDGIQPAVFWNIWRLTPAVYGKIQDHARRWMVKEDLKYVEESAEQSTGYVLEHTIDILLKKAKTRSSFLNVEAETNYMSKPKNGQSFKVYRKADKNSEVVGRYRAMRSW